MKLGKDNLPQGSDKKGIDRRAFLKGAAKLVAGGVAATASGLGSVAYPTVRDELKDRFFAKNLQESIQAKIALIQNFYGVPVDVRPIDKIEAEKVSGLEAKLAQQERALTWVLQELAKYPKHMIRKARISKIKVVDNLYSTQDGYGLMGIALTDSDKEIVVEIDGGILSSDQNFGWSEEEMFRSTLHHEVFHFIDRSALGSYESLWLSLNKDGEDAYSLAFDSFEDHVGFVRNYGRKSPYEDRATLFEALMTSMSVVEKQAQTDQILRKKAEFLKQMLFDASLGLMDRTYWNLVGENRLPSDFFEKRRKYLLSLNFEEFKADFKKDGWDQYINRMGSEFGLEAITPEFFEAWRQGLVAS